MNNLKAATAYIIDIGTYKMKLNILPLPKQPAAESYASPEIVQTLDRIRFDLQEQDEMDEFCWFAREYPRVFRHHFRHAEFRLRSIYSSFEQFRAEFQTQLKTEAAHDFLEMAIGNPEAQRIYWDFESYVTAISAALDVLARICGTAFTQHTPVTFSKFCKNAPDSTLKIILRQAQEDWVQPMKDYRDCFVHYTPADTILSINLVRYSDGLELRAKLPANPKAREILRFRWSRRHELLRYSLRLWKKFLMLDKAVAQVIRRSYEDGQYPNRTTDLFISGKGQPTSVI